ncbi:hypothetical protein AFK68_30855 [Hydrocoleum sp. CS-953]|nr:hypothetical protein AFK68_30855 [Hydrocoleum sp. CS-953]
MDDGRVTDAQGHKVDFKNSVIIMTSNIEKQSEKNNSIEEKDDLRLIIAAERAILNCRMLVVNF